MSDDQIEKHGVVVLVDGKEVERDYFVRLSVIEGYINTLKQFCKDLYQDLETLRTHLDKFYDMF